MRVLFHLYIKPPALPATAQTYFLFNRRLALPTYLWPSSTPDTFGRVNQQKLFKIEENTTEQLTVQPAPDVPHRDSHRLPGE